MQTADLYFDIASVERETGIRKDTLRVWEKRYGFPIPVRAEHDERLYPTAQVEQLRLIKRLIINGLRPSNVVGLTVSELDALLASTKLIVTNSAPQALPFMALIKTHQSAALRLELNRALLEHGLAVFLSKTVIPLNQLVGQSWMRGEMRIFEEHLYSEQLTQVLRNAIGTVRDAEAVPRVLLSTLPGEAHGLGLLMAEAMLSLHGASCVNLGVQTPIQEIASAASAHRASIVVVSFSEAISAPQIKVGLQQLRLALPSEIAVWAGGSGLLKQALALEGVLLMSALTELQAALELWRELSAVADNA